MRARAGTTLALSTVANTAFSSATVFGATVKVSCGERLLRKQRKRSRYDNTGTHRCFPQSFGRSTFSVARTADTRH